MLWGLSWTSHGPLKRLPVSLRLRGPGWGGLGREFFGLPGTSNRSFQSPGVGQNVPYWAYVKLWGLSWTSHGPLKRLRGSLKFHGPGWGLGREFFGVPGGSHGLLQRPGVGQSVLLLGLGEVLGSLMDLPWTPEMVVGEL